MKPLDQDLGGDKIAFACDRFAERAQNGQRVSVESAMGTPENRVAGDVLPEEGRQVRSVVGTFGLPVSWACGEQVEMSEP